MEIYQNNWGRYRKIKDVEVAGRGKSGVVTYILITTNKNKYLVAKELNIRKLFALTKSTTESGKDILMYGARGGAGKYQESPIRRNITLLPASYFVIEYTGGRANIYGGGYGHGVGMGQYTAYDLAKIMDTHINKFYLDTIHTLN